MKLFVVSLTLFCVNFALAQKNPNFVDGRGTIVHLFDWTWSDIADECENFLGPNGFGGVQTSPPNENIIWVQNNDRPWWEAYQPVSYKLENRHGNEEAFKDMVKRCNAVGVRVYPDVVVNHMASISTEGTAGDVCDPTNRDYPAVPYTIEHFHPTCGMDYNSPSAIRNCELSGLPDLNQTEDYVREKIKDYMNHLIEIGVAGFRIDAAKHMWPEDLKIIYGSLNDLNTDYFSAGSRPFFYQEVIDYGNDVVSKKEYIDFGRVCEFKYGNLIGPCFKGQCPFNLLNTFGFDEDQWGVIAGEHTLCFVTNHDTERDNNQFLNYKDGNLYRGAVAFMLAHYYAGVPKVMSGFEFDGRDSGPPHDDNFNILSPVYTETGCSNGWTCEHRWTSVVGMVQFRNVVAGTDMQQYWSNGNQIAFSRGNKGFFATTIGGDINQGIPTTLADGTYCDVMTGKLSNGSCTGKTVTVSGGNVQVQLSAGGDEIAMAIHVESKLS
uniref:Alpha-amylase n=1 Tax=Anthonomus grandis TaxID=7044 RepID=Q8I9K5_ANTGR|nr:alfa-amylase [Anthonomus grandis]